MRKSIKVFICLISSFNYLFAQELKLVLPIGHIGSQLDFFEYSLDKRFIATSIGNEIKIWDAGSSKLIETIYAQENGVYSVHFSMNSDKIITSGYELYHGNDIRIFDLYSKKEIYRYNSRFGIVTDAFFDQKDENIIITSDSLIVLHNLKTGKNEKTLNVLSAQFTEKLTGSNNYITYANPTKIWTLSDTLIELVNIETDQKRPYYKRLHFQQSAMTLSFVNDTSYLYDNYFPFKSTHIVGIELLNIEDSYLSSDLSLLALLSKTGLVEIWDINRKTKLLTINEVKDFGFNPSQKQFSYIDKNSKIHVYSFDKKTFSSLDFYLDYPVSSIFYSNDGEKLLISRLNKLDQLSIEIWDALTLSKKGSLEGVTSPIEYASLTKSSGKLFTSSYNYSIHVFDMNTGEIEEHDEASKDYSEYLNDLSEMNEVVNGSVVNYGNVDEMSVYVSDTNSSLILAIYPIENLNYISMIKDGYYRCSPNIANKLHYITPDLRVVNFEQLDIKFNRPDLVLKSLGNTDYPMINSYYHAYTKRIQRLGIDSNSFNNGFFFPVCNAKLGSRVTSKSTIQLITFHIQALDTSNILDRFNVWINEVPIYGEKGFSLKYRKSNTLDTTITIQLSEGENRIEASVINTNAIESFRTPIYVNFSPDKSYTPKTHFIGIGIDHFKQPDHDLSYSVKDVRDLSRSLKEKLGDQLTIDTLFNENVSISNVAALKTKLLQTNINDKVIISYSGHGLLNEDYDYFLSSYTVDFHHPEKGGIPYEVLEDLLDSIPARKKLLLIDACHSGEVDKDDFREMAAVAGAKGIVKPKGGDAENTSETPTIGLQNSFQLMQELFVNVQKGSGATIISAAGGDQFALEGGKLENGFFTYAILEYMKQNEEVSINALKKYVYEEVERLSGGLQKPTSRLENLEMDWKVW